MKPMVQAALAAAALLIASTAAQVGLASPASAAPGPILKACYNIQALTANDHMVNGPYRLMVYPHAVELRQSVAGYGSSGPDSYEALTWSRADPNMPLASTDRTYLALYCNGDLSLRRSNGALLWHSNTAGKGAVRLVLSNGGNLLLQNAKGQAVWQAGSGRAAMATNSILPYNTKLAGYTYESFGAVLQTLSMQTDGNLVYRYGSTVKWQSNTHVKGSSARLTTKAQLQVVAPNGSTLWSSSPTGTTYSVLDIGLGGITQYRPTIKLVWYPGMP